MDSVQAMMAGAQAIMGNTLSNMDNATAIHIMTLSANHTHLGGTFWIDDHCSKRCQQSVNYYGDNYSRMQGLVKGYKFGASKPK